MNKVTRRAIEQDAVGRHPVEWQEAELVPIIGKYQFGKCLREGTIKYYRTVGGHQPTNKYCVPGIGDDVNAGYLQYLADEAAEDIRLSLLGK